LSYKIDGAHTLLSILNYEIRWDRNCVWDFDDQP